MLHRSCFTLAVLHGHWISPAGSITGTEHKVLGVTLSLCSHDLIVGRCAALSVNESKDSKIYQREGIMGVLSRGSNGNGGHGSTHPQGRPKEKSGCFSAIIVGFLLTGMGLVAAVAPLVKG